MRCGEDKRTRSPMQSDWCVVGCLGMPAAIIIISLTSREMIPVCAGVNVTFSYLHATLAGEIMPIKVLCRPRLLKP